MEILSNCFLTLHNLLVGDNFALCFEKSGGTWPIDSSQHHRCHIFWRLLFNRYFELSNSHAVENSDDSMVEN